MLNKIIPRIAREKKTATVMVRMYCGAHHAFTNGICGECEKLLQYSFHRLDKCPFGDKKPACADCPIHCYKPDMRKRIQEVMRFSGPRMLIRHPTLALRHLWDKTTSDLKTEVSP